MRVHDLKPAPGSTRPRRRVGRGIGGKRGKTAGRGTAAGGTVTVLPSPYGQGRPPARGSALTNR